MSEGVQDQFHQFLATAATPPLPPPPSQSRASLNSLPLLHGSLSPSPSSSHFQIILENCPSRLQQPTHHHQMMQHSLELRYHPQQAKSVGATSLKQQGERENANGGFLSKSFDLGHPWSHDEVLALFRLRTAMENWFPEFTWEHVSRKLEEIGFRRSPQKCKEKFEEECRCLHLNTTNTTSTTNADEVISCATNKYRLFSELEELYHHGCEDRSHLVSDKQVLQKEEEEGLQEKEHDDHQRQERLLDENDGLEAIDNEVEKEKEIELMKGRKRHHHDEMDRSKKKFKIFKSFCEDIANKMMAHQEELHNKILQDLIRRDEENFAREQAWMKQEMERINKEMEARAKDQAMVDARQAKIIEFLKKFTSNYNPSTNTLIINKNDEFNSHILCTHQSPSSSATHSTSPNCHIPTSSNDERLSQTSNSLTPHTDPIAPTINSAPESKKTKPNKRPYDNSDHYDDTRKRWPREEVIALINIRCNLDLTNNTRSDTDCTKNIKNGSLWERISKSMMELGYTRSARRCKEKWENINKYFRKTKDLNKKRLVDSRTCPYFHQLSHLYSHGRFSGGFHGGSGLGGGGGGGDQGKFDVTTSASDF